MAAAISERTGLPWHSVDDLTWRPGWETVEPELQREIFTDICSGERWILDTAYGQWMDVPLARVEVIVALDYPGWFSFLRLLRRSVARAVDGRKICNGNVETFGKLLTPDSILLWHLKSYRRKHDRIVAWEKATNGPTVIRLRTAAEAARWLASIS